ncbi:MAG: hypothetical protein LBL46_02635 [Rickettsiales bacterium]|jgi:hypothetical protein|nr:hypothetical protein [Rickettsiales bacterium]
MIVAMPGWSPDREPDEIDMLIDALSKVHEAKQMIRSCIEKLNARRSDRAPVPLPETPNSETIRAILRAEMGIGLHETSLAELREMMTG